jgi:hypothetical protein
MKTCALSVFFIVIFSLATTQASSVKVPLPGAAGSLPKTISFNAGTSFKHIDEVRLKCSGSITYGLGCGDGVERPVLPYFEWPAQVEASMDPPGIGMWTAYFGSSEGPFNQEKIFDDIIPTTWDFLLDGQADLYINKSSVIVIGGIMLRPPSASVSQATLTIKGTVIDIVSPSLGETLTGGSIYTISWQDYRSQSSCPYNYFMDYSIDGGQNWIAINSEAAAGSCSYDWTVPDVNFQQCMIRITDAGDPNFTDTTTGNFAIHKCPTDLNGDAFIDFLDYAILSPNWQMSPDPCDPNSGDIIKNGIVDIYDLTELCADWLACYVTQAAAPSPADHAVNVSINAVLQWSPGDNAASHDVYFGTDFNEVKDADISSANVYMGNRDANFWDTNNYAPDGLIPDTNYYWHIDELAGCMAKGSVWSFTAHPEPNIDYGLTAWWKFDEGTGTIANDSSGLNYNGTITGATWFEDVSRGWCLNFDSSGDYVTVPDTTALDMSSAITITAWIKPTNFGNYYFIVTKQPSGSAGSNYPGNYEFRTEASSGRLNFLHQTSTGTTFSTYTSSSGLTAGIWQHVVVTLGYGQVNFYINGTPAGTTAQSGTFGILNDEPVRIGKRKDSGSYFNGSINYVRIYNRALSADEILLLYQQDQ